MRSKVAVDGRRLNTDGRAGAPTAGTDVGAPLPEPLPSGGVPAGPAASIGRRSTRPPSRYSTDAAPLTIRTLDESATVVTWIHFQYEFRAGTSGAAGT